MESHTDLQDKAWWHGFMPESLATRVVERSGDFLVRCVEGRNAATIYILTIHSAAYGVLHMTIRKYNGLWCVYDPPPIAKHTFATIPALINYYLEHPIGRGLKLKHPIPQLDPAINRGRLVFAANSTIDLGSFGASYHAKLLRPYRIAVAVSVTVAPAPKHNVQEGEEDPRERILSEARKLMYYNHPNLARFLGIVIGDPSSMLVVCEKTLGGDLLTHLRKFGAVMDNREKLLYLVEAAAGLSFLHSKQIVHGRIAARNCLITAIGRIMITDHAAHLLFNIGRCNGDTQSSEWSAMRPPMRWCAPEMLDAPSTFLASDCWAFGILAYEVFANGVEPWPEMTGAQVECLIREGSGPVLPECTPPRLVALLQLAWRAVPQLRPTMKQMGMGIFVMISDTIRLTGELPYTSLTLNQIPGVHRTICSLSVVRSVETNMQEFDDVLSTMWREGSAADRSPSTMSLPSTGSTYVDAAFNGNNSSIYVEPAAAGVGSGVLGIKNGFGSGGISAPDAKSASYMP